jgi:predicted GNAT family acetyltransferase
MPFLCLHDKAEIEQYLRQDVYLHLYGLGDLDDFFWPHTLWFGSMDNAGLDALALVYTGCSLPTLLALSRRIDAVRKLLDSMRHLLPSRFYAHLSPGVEAVFHGEYDCDPHGEHYKLALKDTTVVRQYDCAATCPLTEAHLEELGEFYDKSYPGNWFDPRMLATGQHYGVREADLLVSVAGIHVFSPRYRVAALGNIATLPSRRGRGYAGRATARLCQSLLEHVEHIGANVKADNGAALSCYRQLGFEIVASYEEFLLNKK